MSQLNKDTVQYVANLARIKLGEGEIENLSGQLAKVLDYIDKLSELDLSNIQPTSHVLPLMNVYRDDVKKKSLPVDETLKNAPGKTGNRPDGIC